jgi:hypothetical protein
MSARLYNALKACSYDSDRIKLLSYDTPNGITEQQMVAILKCFEYGSHKNSALTHCLLSSDDAEWRTDAIFKCFDYDSEKLNALRSLIDHAKIDMSFDSVVKLLKLLDYDSARATALDVLGVYLEGINRDQVTKLTGVFDYDSAKDKVFRRFGQEPPVREEQQGGASSVFMGGGGGFSMVARNGGSVFAGNVMLQAGPGQRIEARDGKVWINGVLQGAPEPEKKKEIGYPEESKKDEEAKEGAPTCSICLTNKPAATAVPCGHRVYCNGCARKWVRDEKKTECIHCRATLEQIITTYDT